MKRRLKILRYIRRIDVKFNAIFIGRGESSNIMCFNVSFPYNSKKTNTIFEFLDVIFETFDFFSGWNSRKKLTFFDCLGENM